MVPGYGLRPLPKPPAPRPRRLNEGDPIRPLAGLVLTHIFRPPQVQFPRECPGFGPKRGSERFTGLPGNLADGSSGEGPVLAYEAREVRQRTNVGVSGSSSTPPSPRQSGARFPTSRETDPDPDLQTKSRDVGNDKAHRGRSWDAPEPGVFDHLAIRYDPSPGSARGILEPAIKPICVTLWPSVVKESLEPQELAESHRNLARTQSQTRIRFRKGLHPSPGSGPCRSSDTQAPARRPRCLSRRRVSWSCGGLIA